MSYAGTDMGHVFTASPGSSSFRPTIAVLNSHDEGHAGWSQEHSAQPVRMSIIGDEMGWRRRPGSAIRSAPRIIAARWESSEDHTREVSAETSDDGYVVGLVLRPMDIRLSVSGRVVQNGVAAPGMMHVTEPSAAAQCLFRGQYDALHLYVPNALLTECAGRAGNTGLLCSEPAPVRDPIALQLGMALLKAEEFGQSFGWIYADGISLAIVTRLLALQAKGRSSPDRSKVVALSKWRLKRAIEYIDGHLDEPISLADVATAAGLSRMHFAAQFKAAIGCRPHDYLLRRRISHAQELMASSAVPLVQVSLQVGFQSQAHFTSVFKRLIGKTPHAWRQSRA